MCCVTVFSCVFFSHPKHLARADRDRLYEGLPGKTALALQYTLIFQTHRPNLWKIYFDQEIRKVHVSWLPNPFELTTIHNHGDALSIHNGMCEV